MSFFDNIPDWTVFLFFAGYVFGIYVIVSFVLRQLSLIYQDYRLMVTNRQLRRLSPSAPAPEPVPFEDPDLDHFDWHGHWPSFGMNLHPALENKTS